MSQTKFGINQVHNYDYIMEQTLHQIAIKSLTTGNANPALYQGVSIGGEIVELIKIPPLFVVTTSGTGGGTPEVPCGYVTPITAFPLGLNWSDANFANEVINVSGLVTWGAGRTWKTMPFFNPHQLGANALVGWQMKLNSITAAARGRAGAGIQNLANWVGNVQCESKPTIILQGYIFSSTISYMTILYAIAKVLNTNSNPVLVVGDLVLFVSTFAMTSIYPQADTEIISLAPPNPSVATDLYIVPSL